MMSRIPVQPPRSAIARALSTGLCVALVGATVATSVPAGAAPLPLLRLAPDEAPASVLGLDGDGKEGNAAARDLTNALRKAFANRGLSGGEEISLEEMRLTMGCDNDEVACLAEGGKTLGVRRLVFGYLKPSGGAFQLDIQILDVEGGQLEAQASITVSKAELAAGEIDTKAAAIVNELMPAHTTDSDLPPRPKPLPETGDPEVEEEQEQPPPPKEKGNLYFGLEKPTPTWKWAGFGTALGLTVIASGVTIGMGVWLTTNSSSFGFRQKLLETAGKSLTDGNPNNDVDPMSDDNLCEAAEEIPLNPDGSLVGEPGQVRNGKMAKLCRDADQVQKAQLAAGIGTAIFGLTTLVFTGLLVIHKRKPAANAMLRHRVRLGVAPTREGGLTFAGGLRF
jgi:hypothetical protein